MCQFPAVSPGIVPQALRSPKSELELLREKEQRQGVETSKNLPTFLGTFPQLSVLYSVEAHHCKERHLWMTRTN